MRRFRRAAAFICVAVVAVLARVAALGGLQAEPPQVPAFKSGVELIAVDVSVVDKAGHPIPRVRFDVDATSNVVKSLARTDVLCPDAVRFFAGRLAAAEKAPAPAGVEAAAAAVRGGQYDGARDARSLSRAAAG